MQNNPITAKLQMENWKDGTTNENMITKEHNLRKFVNSSMLETEKDSFMTPTQQNSL